MIKYLYPVFPLAYKSAAKIASVFNKKAALWVEGRKNWQQNLQVWRNSIPKKPVVWVHCASLGEFEQGRPVLEAIRKQFPDVAVLLSFYSPSGYEVRKNYANADYVTYLPIDTRENAEDFVRIVRPSLVIWVKYDYWYYFLTTLKSKQIPVLLISAIFREQQYFFKSENRFWQSILHSFHQLFVQHENSKKLLQKIGIENVTVAGDTRFDRVSEITANLQPLPETIAKFCGTSPVIVAGSTWPDDEKLLAAFAAQHPEYKFIIAPHEVASENIEKTVQLFSSAVKYSEIDEKGCDKQVLVIDNIGMLASLYQYGHVCYIGGGFNKSGIHNTLEAAAHGRPVVFGPNYQKFNEAIGLIDAGAGFSIKDENELSNALNKLFGEHEIRYNSGNKAKKFVQENSGATKKIMNYIAENRLLTK